MQLKNDNFDVMFYSPLKRAAKTGKIIWDQRKGKVLEMPGLREIDLYSFQVGIKPDAKRHDCDTLLMSCDNSQ